MAQRTDYFYPQLADVEWLRRKHRDEGLDFVQIAKAVGCTPAGARTALVRYGIYQPKRRADQRVLGDVSAEQLLDDATMVTSWWMLAKQYGVARIVVQDHAIVLGVFDQVVQRFCPRPSRSALPAHPVLSSPSWIATTWARSYQLPSVAQAAGVSLHLVRKWMAVHGITVKQLRQARDQAITQEYLGGMRLAELGERYGMDQGGIWRILNRSGVDTSRWKKRGKSERV